MRGGLQAGDDVRQLPLAVTSDAGDAQNLARMDRERNTAKGRQAALVQGVNARHGQAYAALGWRRPHL